MEFALGRLRYGLTVGAVALAYFTSAKFAFAFIQLGSRADASIFYPPAGIALAAALLLGPRAVLGIALGALCFARSLPQVSWSTAIGATLGSTGEVVVSAALLYRWQFDPALRRVRDILVLLSAIYLASALNATLSTLNGLLAELVPISECISHWFTVWLGDAVSMVILTPAVLVWVHSRVFWQKVWGQKRQFRRRAIEVLLWLGSLLLCSAIVLGDPARVLPIELGEIARSLLDYLPFLFVVWAALRLGQRGTVLSLLVVFGLVVWSGTQNSAIPSDQIQQTLFRFQTFLSVMTTIALVLAAAIAERKETEDILQRRIDRDQLLAETTLRIRQSLDIDHILNTTVAEVRQFLDADRVYISLLDREGYTTVVAEAVAAGWRSLLGSRSPRPILSDLQEVFCDRPKLRVNHNSATAPKNEFLTIYYQTYQIQSSIGVPLYQDGELFGVLNVNQCGAPRYWETIETELLEQLATQVEIAIQQGRLYQQIQASAHTLEQQVEERTLQLSQSLAELKQLNALKDTFIHAVSHDFRTPIMGGLMVLRRLQNKPGDTVTLKRSILNSMIDSADRQLQLINSLLEDPDSIVLDYQPTDLHELATTAIANFPLAQATLKNLIPTDLPTLRADPIQIQRVLHAVIKNAIDHNPPPVTLTLRTSVKGDHIQVTIQDDGIGMTPEECQHLFVRPFLRATQNRRRTGLGLGLMLCAQIIAAHQGEIGVRSQPQAGTEIWFTLPLAPPA
jgi:signal transduction histidine kinase/integral membrane sensor domain MASE1